MFWSFSLTKSHSDQDKHVQYRLLLSFSFSQWIPVLVASSTWVQCWSKWLVRVLTKSPFNLYMHLIQRLQRWTGLKNVAHSVKLSQGMLKWSKANERGSGATEEVMNFGMCCWRLESTLPWVVLLPSTWLCRLLGVRQSEPIVHAEQHHSKTVSYGRCRAASTPYAKILSCVMSSNVSNWMTGWHWSWSRLLHCHWTA